MKTNLLTIIALGMLALTSCTKYPPDSERVLEDLAVYTQVDVTANFNNYKTFAINPTVTYINGSDTTFEQNENTTALVDRIILNMTNRGFTQVAATADFDLGINLTALKNTTTTVYYPYYPPYWGYSGYGYYYPYYPTYVTSYSTGTVIIDLADFYSPKGEKIMVIWNAFIRGLLTDTHTQSDMMESVDQAFAQTPSLATTK
jgi:hypothetical protein